MRYKDIRKIAKMKPINEEGFIFYIFSRRLSPFFVSIFLNLKIKPNTITIYMIVTGIIGAILFAFDNIWFKFTGYIFMHLWLILDCADGEVAKITKVFSKYGKELDYIAHIINHPLFNIAILLSLIQLKKYNIVLLAIISISLTSIDLIFRNLFSMYIIYDLKGKHKKNVLNKEKLFRVIIVYLIGFLTQFPNFVLIFPLLYFIDIAMDTSLSIIYFIIVTISSLFLVTRALIQTINKFTKE